MKSDSCSHHETINGVFKEWNILKIDFVIWLGNMELFLGQFGATFY